MERIKFTHLRSTFGTNILSRKPLIKTGKYKRAGALGHFKIWLSLIILFAAVFSAGYSQAQVAAVNPPTGGFNINGGLQANSAAGDWLSGTGAGGAIFIAGNNYGLTSSSGNKRIVDDYNSTSDLIFSGAAFTDNPTTWKWADSKATNKCDINNGMYLVTSSATQKWIIMGGDRYTTTGTSYIDFEFLQNTLTRITDSNGNKTFASAGPNNGRTEGDFVLSMEYSNGGTNATVHYYRWEKPAGSTTYKYVEKTVPAGLAFAQTNGAATNVPFGAFGLTSYIPYAFVEAAVNIDGLLAANCDGLTIKTLFIKTKASDSYNAALKDFVEPQQVNFTFGSATISYSSPFCPEDLNSANRYASPTQSGATGGTYSASPTGLSINSSTGVIDLANSAAGTYTVTYTYNAGGGCSRPATANVVINARPTISTPAFGSICQGTNSVLFSYNAVSSGTDQFRIDWDGNVLTDIPLSSLTVSPITINGFSNIAAAHYTGTIYVKNSTTGCESAGNSIFLDINTNPSLSIHNPDAVCSPSKVNLMADGVTAGSTLPTGTTLSYWTNSNGTGTISDPTQVSAGTYYIKATTNTTPSCSDIKSVVATVNPTPALVITNPTAVCYPGTVSLTGAGVTSGSSLPSGTTLSYFASDGVTPLATPSAVGAGTYYIKATTNSTPACSDTKSVTVSVKDKPARPVVTLTEATVCDTVTAAKLEVNCPVIGIYTLTQTGIQSSKTFNYNGSNGPVLFRKLVPSKGFNITLTIDGCVSDATTCLNMNNSCPLTRQSGSQTTGTASVKDMIAYPIPFYDKVTIKFTSDRDEDYVVNLYDVQGRLVKELKAGFSKAGEEIQIEVDGTRLIGNFYVARKISKSGVSTVKLLKER